VIAFATQGLTPQLTIYLDLPVRVGLARKRAGDATEWNRIEEQALQYHEQVRQGYLQLARTGARWLVLDATATVEQIHHNIVARVAQALA
jgi:dTMP kinase